jgi:hypothetical protein
MRRRKEEAVTERQSNDLIEMLRDRLGMQYHAGVDEGRREIARVLADATQMGHDEADAAVSRMIDSGMIRYVTGAERDVDRSVAPGEDAAFGRDRTDRTRGGLDERADDLSINAIPGTGGPQAATSGMLAGAPAPIAAGGLGAPPATPLAAGDGITASAEDLQRGGYWEFTGDKAGVVPSSTRKGQVEPRGT